MVEVIFSNIRCNRTQKSEARVLRAPERVLKTQSLDEVLPFVTVAEAEALAGKWVVLLLSYEAAPAFDSAMRTHSAGEFPLAMVAVFAGPTEERDNPTTGDYTVGKWQPKVSRSQFDEAIRQIRALIARGNTYQVNYTFPITAGFAGNPLKWYGVLCEQQRATYNVYLDLGRFKVLSLSPELFFERTGDLVRAKPMKGTIKRGRWSAEDDLIARALYLSSKDRAENVMIVDLLRNDLGKVSVPGSVCVKDLFAVERYPTLWQMTSTIESRLKPNTSLANLMTALFPCGSITGAPKIRTMDIIHELELSPRQIYTGAIGLIKPGGDCTFNVAIRTVLIDSETGTATFGVGGGITYNSTADNEYEECLLKTSFLTAAAARFELLESLLLEDGEYFLLDRHLARLAASANYFQFRFDEALVLRQLAEVKQTNTNGNWKVRLVLRRSGEVSCETSRVEKEMDHAVRVSLAAAPVNSGDFSLYHKLTTNRDRFRNLARRADSSEVILWNERSEITESSVANLVMPVGGKLITPPISSGLLPGTFRESLLEEGEICEGVITVDELRRATEFYLINSVRRWRSARLIDD